MYATLISDNKLNIVLIAGNPLEPFKLQHKDEINLSVNV